MQLHHLPPGEHAGADSDRIAIIVLPNGHYGFAGTVGRDADRVGLIGPNLFRSEADALDAACAWSADHGVHRLMVERSKL